MSMMDKYYRLWGEINVARNYLGSKWQMNKLYYL